MDFKPRIFIGSSKEGYNIASKVEKQLKNIAEIQMWTKAFEYGKSNYENLISQISLYDFAILIATADDIATSRGEKLISARDNVLFEFGLFSGGLGNDKTFFIVEKGIKIPSDLAGITLPQILSKENKDFNKSLNNCVSEIQASIKSNESTYDLSFLPSTALAYGYFVNFVERTVERLLEDKLEKKKFKIGNGKEFRIKEIKFTVLIPDDLSDDMFKKVKAKKLKDGWEKLKVDPKDVRDYDFAVDVSQTNNGRLHLVDIPFTLNALNMAIDLYSKKSHIGKNERESLLEYREIRNFQRTLEYLIKKSAIAKNIVNIEIVSI